MVNLTSAGYDEDESTNDEDGDDVYKQQTALLPSEKKAKLLVIVWVGAKANAFFFPFILLR